MACTHKFSKHLMLKDIDFTPTKLVIGTFNPGWECLDNKAEWFYGRTSNNYFWDLFPAFFEIEDLRTKTPFQWKQFCRENKVGITDLITSINDANIESEDHKVLLKGYDDTKIAKGFKDFTYTDVLSILKSNPEIKSVYITRQSDNGGFWDTATKDILNYCNQNKIEFKNLMTPSKNARFQMTKGSGLSLRDFINDDWIKKYYF